MDYKNTLFSSESEIYLASADRMDSILNNLRKLKLINHLKIETYSTVIGGLSGLNYLIYLNPKKIIFFDINKYMLDYAKLIIEIIK